MSFDKRKRRAIIHTPVDCDSESERKKLLSGVRWNLRIIKPKKYVEPTTLLFACDKIRPPYYETLPEKHNFWEFTLILKGNAVAICDEKEIPVSDGMLITFKPMQLHYMKEISGNELEFMNASFELSGEDEKMFEDMVIRLSKEETALFKEAVSSLDMYYRNVGNPKNLQKGFALFEGFLSSLVISAEDRKRATTDPRYFEIVKYLGDNIDKKLTLEKISSDCGMSESLIKKLFTHHCDRGVMSYFSHAKAIRAAELLDSGLLPEEVTKKLSYSSLEYFFYCFKREIGITPGKYIKQNNKED